MSSATAPPSGNPLVSIGLDGSLKAHSGEFTLLVALREPSAQPAAVVVTLEREHIDTPPGQWEFPIWLHELGVMVGEAEATEGEAPLLRVSGGDPAWPVDIDDLFTRLFRLFCLINKERLTMIAMGTAPHPVAAGDA